MFSSANVLAAATCSYGGVTTDCALMLQKFKPFLIFAPILLIVVLAVVVISIISLWKIFTKAGKPGWTAIIPIYNIIVLCEIVGKPTWWIFLYFIPIVNIVVKIIVSHRLSLSFKKDIAYTIGLIFLPFIFLPILAFGQSTYTRLPDSQS